MVKPNNELSPQARQKMIDILAKAIPPMEQAKKKETA